MRRRTVAWVGLLVLAAAVAAASLLGGRGPDGEEAWQETGGLPLLVPAAHGSVLPGSGRLALEVVDLPGAGALEVRRSLLALPGPGEPLGAWRLSWQRSLRILDPAQPVLREGGGTLTFTRRGSSWVAPGGDLLVQQGHGYACIRPDGTSDEFDETGRYLRHVTRGGLRLAIALDALARVERVTAPDGSGLEFRYDLHHLLGVRRTDGRSVGYHYDRSDLVRVERSGQPPLRYAYADGRPSVLAVPPLAALHVTYDAQGRVLRRGWGADAQGGERFEYTADGATRHTAVDGTTTTTAWEPGGGRLTVSDEAGHAMHLAFDEAGLLTEAVPPSGRATKLRYDEEGRLARIEAPEGAASLTYRGAGYAGCTLRGEGSLAHLGAGAAAVGCASASDVQTDERDLPVLVGAGPDAVRLAYDADGRLVGVTDAAGSSTTLAYDDLGRWVASTDPAGGRETVTYGPGGLPQSRTDAAGGVTRYAYAGRSIVVTDADGRAERVTLTPLGQVESVTNGAGESTHYEYDALGHVRAATRPDGQRLTWSRDADGRLTGFDEPAGATRITYASGRCTATQSGGRVAIAMQHEGRGALTLGRATGTFDEEGRLTSWVGPGPDMHVTYGEDGLARLDLGGVRGACGWRLGPTGSLAEFRVGALTAHAVLDAAGRTAGWRDDLGRGSTVEYDALGRVVAERDALGGVARWTRDAVGRPTSYRDPQGRTWRYAWSPAGDLVGVTDPLEARTTYAYDAAHRLSGVTLPGRAPRTLHYDALGRLLREDDGLGHAVGSAYDAAGRVTVRTNARGQRIDYQYDEAGRLRERSMGGEAVRFAYGATGLLVEARDAGGSLAYEYADDGALLAVTGIAGAGRVRVARSLDAETGLPAGYGLAVGPDGRCAGITRGQDGAAGAIWIGLGADAAGRRTDGALPGGIRAQFEFDAGDRIGRLEYRGPEDRLLLRLAYAYDRSGLPVARTISADGRADHRTTFDYDGAGRLVRWEPEKSAPLVLTYLPTGQRATAERGRKGAIQYAYDGAGRLVRAADVAYAYDDDGNRVARTTPRGTTRYRYDAANRLVEVILEDGDTVRYGYGPDGQRAWRRDKEGEERYVTYGGRLVQVLAEDGAVRTTLLHDPVTGRPLAFTEGGATYPLLTDLEGTVVACVEPGGRVRRLEYGPFGNLFEDAGGISPPVHFAGLRLDPATHLYHMGARDYDPETGTFLSRDPHAGTLADPASLDGWVYARSAPTAFVDPLGTFDVAALADQFGMTTQAMQQLVEMTEELARRMPASFRSTAAQFRQDVHRRLVGQLLDSGGSYEATFNELNRLGGIHRDFVPRTPLPPEAVTPPALRPPSAPVPGATRQGVAGPRPGRATVLRPRGGSEPEVAAPRRWTVGGVATLVTAGTLSAIHLAACLREGGSLGGCLLQQGAGLLIGAALGALIGAPLVAVLGTTGAAAVGLLAAAYGTWRTFERLAESDRSQQNAASDAELKRKLEEHERGQPLEAAQQALGEAEAEQARVVKTDAEVEAQAGRLRARLGVGGAAPVDWKQRLGALCEEANTTKARIAEQLAGLRAARQELETTAQAAERAASAARSQAQVEAARRSFAKADGILQGMGRRAATAAELQQRHEAQAADAIARIHGEMRAAFDRNKVLLEGLDGDWRDAYRHATHAYRERVYSFRKALVSAGETLARLKAARTTDASVVRDLETRLARLGGKAWPDTADEGWLHAEKARLETEQRQLNELGQAFATSGCGGIDPAVFTMETLVEGAMERMRRARAARETLENRHPWLGMTGFAVAQGLKDGTLRTGGRFLFKIDGAVRDADLIFADPTGQLVAIPAGTARMRPYVESEFFPAGSRLDSTAALPNNKVYRARETWVLPGNVWLNRWLVR